MKKKKITIIMAYDYEDKNIFSNEKIAERIKGAINRGCNQKQERTVSVVVDDFFEQLNYKKI